MRYRVDPRKVREVVMKDGTTYRVGRSGYVSVRGEHAREMELGASRYHDLGERSVEQITIPGYLGPRGWECPACGFAAWPWQPSCARCGEARP